MSSMTAVKEYTESEMFKIMAGMDDVNTKMAKNIEAHAPKCHFRKMSLEQSDSVDGHYSEWWECSVCGHIKEL